MTTEKGELFFLLRGEKEMVEIRYVQLEDKELWYRLDRHLPEQEFDNKIRDICVNWLIR